MPLLAIENLRKTYRTPDGETQVVLDVPGFVLEEKQQLALRGTSGTGKTTLLNCIAGILSPDSGRITLAGHDMARSSEGQRDLLRAENIGYIFQTFNLLQGYTCQENVMLGMSFGKGVDHDYVRHLLSRVGLNDRLNYRPSQLSAGQQQRVAVARALANRPKLVLADEPTGNLDPANAEAIWVRLSAFAEAGGAVIMVTHDDRAAERASRSLLMDKGQLKK